MLSRRSMLLGSAAAVAVFVLPDGAKAVSVERTWSEFVVPAVGPDETEWLKYLEQMSLSELQAHYCMMTRHCEEYHLAIVRRSGPLHEDWFYRMRQQVYRRLIYLESGMVLGDGPGMLMHFPV
jgi:hypothetical protein